MPILIRSRSVLRLWFIATGSIASALILLLSAPVNAQSNSSIAQGFKTNDSNVTVASLVGAQQGDANTVELSNISNDGSLVGVVSTKPLIELSDGYDSVQVVTSGLTSALVSNINGSIVNGDKITASPIDGVGMKATNSSVIVGIAEGNLNSVPTEERSLTAKNGSKQTVKIGVIPIQVGVAYYTVSSSNESLVPSFLQQLANNLAGKNVSPIRLLIAGLVLLLLIITVTALLYSAIRNSFVSIGRNPLSAGAVRKALVDVGVTIAILLVFAILSIYLVLAA